MAELLRTYETAINSVVNTFPLASFGLLLFAGTLPIFLVSPTARRRVALALLPRIRGKLTREALLDAARGAPLVRLPDATTVLVTNPTLARDICASDGFARDTSAYARYVAFLGGSLVLLPEDGGRHAAVRAALLPLFTAARATAGFDALLACAQRLVAKLGGDASRVADGGVALYRPLQRFALEASGAAFLAHDFSGADGLRLIALLEEFLDEPPAADPAARAANGEAAVFGRWEKILDDVVASQERAVRDGGTPCVLSALASSGAVDDDIAALHGETRRQSAGLIFAALNSAKELKAAVRLLADEPELQAAARAEVDGALRGAPPTAESLKRLPACAAFVSEALRLDPGIEHAKFVARRDMWLKLPAGSAAPHRALLMWLPLPQSRSAYIGRGTTLVVSPHVMHRHPLHWEAPADEADPRRFAAEATAARPPGAYIPFSAGRKRCIAMGHALQQLQLVVVLLLQHFELRPLRGSEAVALHAREAKPPE